MRMAHVDFYFDVVCPYAYLAHTQIESFCHNAELRWKPILLGGLFKLTGNRSPVEAYADIRNKLDYERLELQRFVERHKLAAFTRNYLRTS